MLCPLPCFCDRDGHAITLYFWGVVFRHRFSKFPRLTCIHATPQFGHSQDQGKERAAPNAKLHLCLSERGQNEGAAGKRGVAKAIRQCPLDRWRGRHPQRCRDGDDGWVVEDVPLFTTKLLGEGLGQTHFFIRRPKRTFLFAGQNAGRNPPRAATVFGCPTAEMGVDPPVSESLAKISQSLQTSGV